MAGLGSWFGCLSIYLSIGEMSSGQWPMTNGAIQVQFIISSIIAAFIVALNDIFTNPLKMTNIKSNIGIVHHKIQCKTTTEKGVRKEEVGNRQ